MGWRGRPAARQQAAIQSPTIRCTLVVSTSRRPFLSRTGSANIADRPLWGEAGQQSRPAREVFFCEDARCCNCHSYLALLARRTRSSLQTARSALWLACSSTEKFGCSGFPVANDRITKEI
jgi:hypothetical protein